MGIRLMKEGSMNSDLELLNGRIDDGDFDAKTGVPKKEQPTPDELIRLEGDKSGIKEPAVDPRYFVPQHTMPKVEQKGGFDSKYDVGQSPEKAEAIVMSKIEFLRSSKFGLDDLQIFKLIEVSFNDFVGVFERIGRDLVGLKDGHEKAKTWNSSRHEIQESVIEIKTNLNLLHKDVLDYLDKKIVEG